MVRGHMTAHCTRSLDRWRHGSLYPLQLRMSGTGSSEQTYEAMPLPLWQEREAQVRVV